MADRDLADYDAELAAKVQVIPDLDVRLAFIDVVGKAQKDNARMPVGGVREHILVGTDPDIESESEKAQEDKYHVLQGLKDTTAGGEPKCCYCYQRWGDTGTRGEIQLHGPMLEPEVALAIAKVFREKTGGKWGTLTPGDKALEGKYWLQQQATPDFAAKWEYYVSDGVDGKATGWYPYVETASPEVEELYAQHIANSCESRTSTRSIRSGHFHYGIDLTKMKQKNTRTGKIRTIRRSCGNEEGSMPIPGRMSMKRAMKAATRPSAKRITIAMAPMRSMKERAATKSARKKPMKVAMKVPMKAMKKKKGTTIGSKWQVLKGSKLKTKGGMKADDLMKNKSGRVVSKKQHAMGRKAYETNLLAWVKACTKARNELALTGFVAVKKGTEIYNRAKALMSTQ